MCKQKNGWHMEPLIWLTLVWYMPLLIIADLVQRNVGTRTLLLLTTVTAIVIMFPFSEIRRAQYRVKFLALKQIEYARPRVYWKWWRMPSKELIPVCLAWRVPIKGVEEWGHSHIILDSKQLQDELFPNWFLEENAYQNLSIRMLPLDSEFRANWQSDNAKTQINCFRPRVLGVYGNRDYSPWSGHTHEAALVEKVDCNSVNRIVIQNVELTEPTCRHLFAHRLEYIALWRTNAGKWLLELDRKFPNLKRLQLDRVDQFNEQGLLRLLQNSPSLSSVTIPYEYITEEVLQYMLDSPIQEIVFAGRDGPIHHPLNIPISCVKRFEFLNFCDISAESLIEIGSLNSKFRGCSIKSTEYERFQQLLGDPNYELAPTTRATMLKQIQFLLDHPNGGALKVVD